MHKTTIIVLITGLIALGYVNFSIFQKETLLKDGETVFLELAPVDPRSLMQGDYMALRFKIGNDIQSHLRKQSATKRLQTQNGIAVVALDDKSIGHFIRIDDNQQTLSSKERFMKFRLRNERVKFATNAFFFQEGTAHLYSTAKYGEFRVDASGNLLLTDLRGEVLEKLADQNKTNF